MTVLNWTLIMLSFTSIILMPTVRSIMWKTHNLTPCFTYSNHVFLYMNNLMIGITRSRILLNDSLRWTLVIFNSLDFKYKVKLLYLFYFILLLIYDPGYLSPARPLNLWPPPSGRGLLDSDKQGLSPKGHGRTHSTRVMQEVGVDVLRESQRIKENPDFNNQH